LFGVFFIITGANTIIFCALSYIRFSLDYLQIVRPLEKTGDDHIEESTEYNEEITEQGSTEYNGLCTEYKEESAEYNSVSTRNNEENPKQS